MESVGLFMAEMRGSWARSDIAIVPVRTGFLGLDRGDFSEGLLS